MALNSTELEQIVEAFEPFDRDYKRSAVDRALAHQEDIAPYLLKVLRAALAEPNQYADKCSHIYAALLLSHFRNTDAHALIVQLSSLPEDQVSTLFGDLITEDLPNLLLRTCDGSVDQIKGLIINRDAYEFCRGAAFRALGYAVTLGYESREDARIFLETLFTGNEAAPSSEFWSFAVSTIADLRLVELLPLVEKAYQDELAYPGIMTLGHVHEMMEDSDAQASTKLQAKIDRKWSEDFHDQMSWWAMFESVDSVPRKKPTFALPTKSSGVSPLGKPTTNDKNKKKPVNKKKQKSKRKSANASRKKNRR